MKLRGGPYKEVHGEAAKKEHRLSDGTRFECHHLFPASILAKLGLDPDEGPVVQLPVKAHVEETETYGRLSPAFKARAAIERTLRAAQHNPAHIDVAWERAADEIRNLGPDYADALAEATAYYQQVYRPTLEAAVEAMHLVSQEAFDRAVAKMPPAEPAGDPGVVAGGQDNEELSRRLGERAQELKRLLPEHTIALAQLSKPGEVSLMAACQGRPLAAEQKEVLRLMGFKILEVPRGEDPSGTILRQATAGYEIDAVGAGTADQPGLEAVRSALAPPDHTIDTRAISEIGHPTPNAGQRDEPPPQTAPAAPAGPAAAPDHAEQRAPSTVDLPVPPVKRSTLDELEWSVAKLAAQVESAASPKPSLETKLNTAAVKLPPKVGEPAPSLPSKLKTSIPKKIGGITL